MGKPALPHDILKEVCDRLPDIGQISVVLRLKAGSHVVLHSYQDVQDIAFAGMLLQDVAMRRATVSPGEWTDPPGGEPPETFDAPVPAA